MAVTIDWSPAGDPWAAAVLLHPHPDYGGDRYNHVISTLYQALPAAGVSCARFDFSSSDPATAAVEAVAAIDAVAARQATTTLFLVGYSFGGDIALSVGDERITGWFVVAAPLAIVAPDQMAAARDPRPKNLAVPERDQFSTPDRTREATSAWPAATVTVIPGAEHFLGIGADVAAQQAVAWVDAIRIERSR
jgi:alpha/beta superfamily hydrolase